MSEINANKIDKATGSTLTVGDSGTTVNIAGTAGTGFPTPTSGIAASAIDSGTIATARLGSGTASSSTFLRGDQTYAATEINTPLWKIWRSGVWSLSTGADTKVPFNTWSLDPDSVLDASNNRVVPAVAGKYFIVVQARMDSSTDFNMFYVDIRIDGAKKSEAQVYHDQTGTVTTSLVVNLTASNYIESYAMQNSGGTINGMGGVMNTWIQGFKISS